MAKKRPVSAEVIEFVEEFCLIPEGHAVGQPMKLMDWQSDFIREVFDNEHGTRRAILSVGRKNAKTCFIGALLLAYVIGPLAQANAQVYSAALSREQASLIFSLMAKMVRMNPDLSAHIHIRDSAKELYCTMTGVKFRALSADANTAMGLSPICFCLDEAGQVVGPEYPLYSALHTAQGAHAAPIEFVISTQAANDADFLSQMIDDARTGADPRTVCRVYEAPAGCDVLDRDAWRAANPALGTIASEAYVEQLANEAKRLPSRESQFRNLVLNQRVSLRRHLIPMEVWKANGGYPDPDVFEEFPVYGGLDLSSKLDLTALVLVARDKEMRWHVDAHFWTPADTLHERAMRDRAPYDQWERAGLLTAVPGKSIDYRWVAERVGEIAGSCDLRVIAFDRWRIDDLKRALEEKGIQVPLEPFGQGHKDMGPAVEVLEGEAANERIRHGMHPVLTMCASNCIGKPDETGARKPDKAKSSGRIDGLVALCMAMGIAARHLSADRPTSVYELLAAMNRRDDDGSDGGQD